MAASAFGHFSYKREETMAEYLGELEQVVMLAVARLGPGAYGVAVRNEIEGRAGRSLSLGAVYSTLYRLEEKGYLTSSRGEPTAERGGRAKRVFAVEAPGLEALDRTRRMLDRMWEGAEPALRLSPS
jgi:PadR family transcriptional regulator PadR